MTSGRRPQIILHIGSDKAGSTAIQTHIFGNLDWLAGRGIEVPREHFRSGSAHGALFRDWSAEKAAGLKAELERLPAAEHVLLSCEGLHFFDKDKLRILAHCLRGYAMRIIFYLREQADVIQTGTLQQIKQGNRFIDLFEQMRAPIIPDTRNYLGTVERWQEAFPGVKVDAVLYDRTQFPNDNIVSDFFTRVAGDTEGMQLINEEVNSSLDVISARALNLLDLETGIDRRPRREYIDLLLRRIRRHGAGERYFLDAEKVAMVRRHFADTNRELIRRYGVSGRLLDAPRDVVRRHTITDAEAKQRLEELRETMQRQDYVPMMTAGLKRGTELQRYLQRGWSKAGEGGAQAVAPRSSIALRPSLEMRHPFIGRYMLRLHGAYRPSLTPSTEVLINGRSLGAHDLRRADIEIPLNEVKRNGVVRLVLVHPSESASGAEPHRRRRNAGYRLSGLGMRPV